MALQNPQNSNKLNQVNEMLSGKRMSEANLLVMMTKLLGISKDIATEVVKNSKENILLQVSQSILAQANSAPNGVLTLLK